MASWFVLRLVTGEQLDPTENYKDALAVVDERPYSAIVDEPLHGAVVSEPVFAVAVDEGMAVAVVEPDEHPVGVVEVHEKLSAEIGESRNVAVVTIPGKPTAKVD